MFWKFIQIPNYIMALSTELLKRLNEEDEPLPKRLKLAKNAFKHTELYIYNKEETVLKWLCDRGVKGANSVDVWQALQECLCSSRMTSLSVGDIRSSAKSELIQVLNEYLSSAEINCATPLQCTVHLLENASFQYYFKKQLDDYVSLMNSFFKVVSRIKNVELFKKCVESILFFSKHNLNRHEFQSVFIQELLVPLVDACSKVKSEENSDVLNHEVVKCIQQIVFPKAKHNEVVLCIKSVFGLNGDSENVRTSLFVQLSNAVRSLPEDVISHLYKTIFQAFVSSFKNENSTICCFFIILCYFLGFKPCVKIKDCEKKKSLLKFKNVKKIWQNEILKPDQATPVSLSVLKVLIDTLIEANVLLDPIINEISFKDWLQALILNVVIKLEVKAITLDILCSIISLNPLIVEANISHILERTLLLDKSCNEVRASYISFLRCVLAMFVKLSRLQKLISKLLTTLNKVVNEQFQTELHTSLDIMPEEICTEFCQSVTTLPSQQTVAMTRCFTYHLIQDCIESLEKNQFDDGMLLHVQVVADLVCHFLSGVRIAEHSVLPLVVDRFIQALVEFREALGRLGTALLQKPHCRRLMVAYLRMCYSCGELQVLLVHYSPRCETNTSLKLAALQGDISATNLNYLHSYLSNEQWDLMAQRITNFGEDVCKEMLHKLVLQKLRGIVLFSEETKSNAEFSVSIAKHIVNHISETWSLLLGSNAAMVIPLLGPEQLQHVAEFVVQHLTQNQQAEILQRPAVQENRLLVVALTWASLHQIGKLFTKTKRKRNSSVAPSHSNSQLIRHLIATLDPQVILHTDENRVQNLSTVISEMASFINGACESYSPSDPVVTNGFVLDSALLEQYLKILQNLPLVFLSRDMKTIVVFSVIVVTMSITATKIEDEDQRRIINNLCINLLQALLDSPGRLNLASHLHVGHLMVWLLGSHLTTPILLDQLFNMCLHQQGALQQLEVAVELLNKGAAKQTQSKSSLDLAALFLQMLSRTRKQVAKEDRALCTKYKRRLSQGIVRFVKRNLAAETPEPPRDMMSSFNLALQRYYMIGDGKKICKITPYIDTFYQAAVSVLTSSATSQQHVSASLSLLGTLLEHKAKLQQWLPPDFVPQVWNILSSESLAKNATKQLVKLFQVASDKEFENITQKLLAEMQVYRRVETEDSKLNGLVAVWQSMVMSDVNKSKYVVFEAALHEVCLLLFNIVVLDTSSSYALPLLQLELKRAQKRQVKGNPQLLDVFLQTVANIPLQKEIPLKDFLVLVNTSVELLIALLLHWTVLVLDRIPLFLQGYRHLVNHIAERSSQDNSLPEREIFELANSAHGIEKLTSTIVKNNKSFARVSAYLVADVMHQFEMFTIYPTIKVHLLNSVYSLLQLCDKYALAHLMRSLPPASTELFKSVYSKYKKYYRFTGKV